MTQQTQTYQATAWPKVTVRIDSSGSGELTIGGITEPITTANVAEARNAALSKVAARAAQMQRPLHALSTDPSGTWPLIVHPDGSVEEDPSQPSQPVDEQGDVADRLLGPVEHVIEEPQHVSAETDHQHTPPDHPSAADADPADDPMAFRGVTPKQAPEAAQPLAATSPVPPAAEHGGEPGAEEHAPTRRQRRAQRESFLTTEQQEKPATQGWRGWLTSMGIRLSPSEAERAEREDQRLVSKHWPGPRTIAVVNGKGGASKTPTTVLLSAVFARAGSQVIAWDNNQTRGTLGWRTEQGDHEATVLDLIPEVERLLGAGAQSADLASFVHHQPIDKFDVLRSQPMRLAAEQRVDAGQVARVHQALSKYYRLLLMDSGNDESDPMWLRMIELADQIVVATTTRADHAEAGALLLDGLAESDEDSARLADNAVVIVSQAEPKAPPSETKRVADGYRDLARDVVEVPFDPGMVDGHLQFDALRPVTQRAWLAAAAAVARGL